MLRADVMKRGDEARALYGEAALTAGDLVESLGDVLSSWER